MSRVTETPAERTARWRLENHGRYMDTKWKVKARHKLKFAEAALNKKPKVKTPEESAHTLEKYISYHAKYREDNAALLSMKQKAYREANSEKIKALQQARYIRDKDKHLAAGAAYRVANADKIKKYRADNIDKLHAANKKYRTENPHIIAAIAAKRRAKIYQRTPTWFDELHVQAIYKCAAELTASTGMRYEVDHIIPIQGANVSGLHWHHNMQIIKKEDNVRKHNRFNIEDYTHELPIY